MLENQSLVEWADLFEIKDQDLDDVVGGIGGSLSTSYRGYTTISTKSQTQKNFQDQSNAKPKPVSTPLQNASVDFETVAKSTLKYQPLLATQLQVSIIPKLPSAGVDGVVNESLSEPKSQIVCFKSCYLNQCLRKRSESVDRTSESGHKAPCEIASMVYQQCAYLEIPNISVLDVKSQIRDLGKSLFVQIAKVVEIELDLNLIQSESFRQQIPLDNTCPMKKVLFFMVQESLEKRPTAQQIMKHLKRLELI